MKKLSKLFAISFVIALAVLMFTACASEDETPSATESETVTTVEKEITEIILTQNTTVSNADDFPVNQYITFGKYEQNNIEKDGKEDISWLVLAKEDNKILIISEYTLDCKNYHNTVEDVTWETCDLRKWLNKDFYEEAFTESEQKRILETSLENKDNSEYGTKGGNPTVDKIFVLSEEECDKYFPNNIPYNATLRASPTDYAVAKGATKGGVNYEPDPEYDYDGVWWLRTPGGLQNTAMCIIVEGLKKYGPVDNYWKNEGVFEDSIPWWGASVRPAMWITVE